MQFFVFINLFMGRIVYVMMIKKRDSQHYIYFLMGHKWGFFVFLIIIFSHNTISRK